MLGAYKDTPIYIIKDMQQKISQTPKSEEELIELKQYIADHDKNLKILDSEVNYVYEFLQILEEYCFEFKNIN